VVGREELVFQLAGESRAASERRSETTVCGGESSSNVLGTNMQRLRPSATLAFFHLLAMVGRRWDLSDAENAATQKGKSSSPEIPDLKWLKAWSFAEREEMGFYEK